MKTSSNPAAPQNLEEILNHPFFKPRSLGEAETKELQEHLPQAIIDMIQEMNFVKSDPLDRRGNFEAVYSLKSNTSLSISLRRHFNTIYLTVSQAGRGFLGTSGILYLVEWQKGDSKNSAYLNFLQTQSPEVFTQQLVDKLYINCLKESLANGSDFATAMQITLNNFVASGEIDKSYLKPPAKQLSL